MDKMELTAAKKAAGHMAADMVEPGMVIGLGTGSTVFYAMERLKERIATGLCVTGVPTSLQTAQVARSCGIPLTSLDEHPVLDLAIDGADQVDPELRLIKGRGAAHVREKCVAAAADRFIVVVDESKITDRLDAPVPVEVIAFAVTPVILQLKALGGDPVIREGVRKDGPVLSDNGNIIIDCRFETISSPEDLEKEITCIPGVVGCGLFTTMMKKTQVVIGSKRECRILPSLDIVP